MGSSIPADNNILLFKRLGREFGIKGNIALKRIGLKTSILSPRGKVLENGMPRFFRRLFERVFDLEDLRIRSHKL